MQAIEILQIVYLYYDKKSIREVNNLYFYAHASNSYLDMIPLKLEDLYKFKISVIMYFAANNQSYDFFSSRLIINNRKYGIRKSNLFVLPK